MVSRTKLYGQLDRHEAELQEQLIPHLEIAAKGDNDFIFCVKRFNPFPELRGKTDKLTEDLIRKSSIIIALMSKLDEESKGSIAERICWYCQEWGNIKNPNRKSAKGLAIQFLAEIQRKNRSS